MDLSRALGHRLLCSGAYSQINSFISGYANNVGVSLKVPERWSGMLATYSRQLCRVTGFSTRTHRQGILKTVADL